ncbi:uncharacterized protein [Paramormyrops kingsleyae]|uniref:uncharacterized protein n=1 Tax=Paramormyrops kingsleyae TaxID=1676925 RepID=UPI003B96E615
MDEEQGNGGPTPGMYQWFLGGAWIKHFNGFARAEFGEWRRTIEMKRKKEPAGEEDDDDNVTLKSKLVMGLLAGPAKELQLMLTSLCCGEPGHMARRCPEEGKMTASSWRVRPEVRPGTATIATLREALVGESPVLEVMAAGRPVPCILDTGSEVTLFSRSLFAQCVRGTEVKGAAEVPWLTLRAVNGLSLPYVGYAVLDFTVTGVEVQHLPSP